MEGKKHLDATKPCAEAKEDNALRKRAADETSASKGTDSKVAKDEPPKAAAKVSLISSVDVVL
jgi:hypothetical protein